MKYMGIDFGLKRIGLAFSDETEMFAMPHVVIANSKDVAKRVIEEGVSNNVDAYVVGESKNFAGKDNPIMEYIKVFVEELKNISKRDVYLEPEFMTSAHAEKLQGKHKLLDASAAALILQSFLDRKRSGLSNGV